jgi:hypothetical protein
MNDMLNRSLEFDRIIIYIQFQIFQNYLENLSMSGIRFHEYLKKMEIKLKWE